MAQERVGGSGNPLKVQVGNKQTHAPNTAMKDLPQSGMSETEGRGQQLQYVTIRQHY